MRNLFRIILAIFLILITEVNEFRKFELFLFPGDGTMREESEGAKTRDFEGPVQHDHLALHHEGDDHCSPLHAQCWMDSSGWYE